MEGDEEQGTQLTREQLYELVWSEPMQVIAPRLGLSDVGLKKVCNRLRVPTPGRGYWAKKAAGVAPHRAKLPKLPASVRANQRIAVFSGRSRSAQEKKAEGTGPVADQARYEALPEHRIVVPELLTDPHALVAASIRFLRRAKTDQQHRLVLGSGRCLAVAVTLDSVDRAMLIYDTLIKACEARGFAVEVTVNEQTVATVVTVGEEAVGIVIEERIDRVEHPAPQKAAWPYAPKTYDYVPTGRLAIRFQHPYLGVRQSWSDGKRQRVEDCLNNVMVGLVTTAEALKAQRRAREAAHRDFLAEQERQRLAEQRRQEEAGRIRALDATLMAWRKSALVREYADAMRQAVAATGRMSDGEPLSSWLEWVENYADRIDPTKGVPRVPADPERSQWSSYGRRSEAYDSRGLW